MQDEPNVCEHGIRHPWACHECDDPTLAEVRAIMDGKPFAGGSTLDLVRHWMMSDDHPANDWERDFAAAIDAHRQAAPASGDQGMVEAVDREAADEICNPKDDKHLYAILCKKFARHRQAALTAVRAQVDGRKFQLGDRVTKTKGSAWTGLVVGFYSTSLTPIGYAVESENEPGSVQIYPESALAAGEHRKEAR